MSSGPRLTAHDLAHIGERDALKKVFGWEGVKQIASKGRFGALIPKKYGGHAEEWGVTGAAIILEESSRAAELGLPLGPPMYGSATQLVHNGNEEQKQKWLPKISKGELVGCITMTEPYAGSDIAAIESSAVREGDFYVINGKKCFQTSAAAADMYMCYFLTSTKPEDKAGYTHLTALVVEQASAIIPFVSDRDILMVRQYRYALGRETLEIPAGKLDPGENPEQCIRRELLEETGYEAGSLELVCTYAPALGYSNELIHIYSGRGLRKAGTAIDTREIASVEKIPVEKLKSMIREGSILDGKTLLGLSLMRLIP